MFKNLLLSFFKCQIILQKVSVIFGKLFDKYIKKEGKKMKRNGKNYKVFSLRETEELKEFVKYCAENNKIMSRELLKAIAFYLQNIKKHKKGGQKWEN